MWSRDCSHANRSHELPAFAITAVSCFPVCYAQTLAALPWGYNPILCLHGLREDPDNLFFCAALASDTVQSVALSVLVTQILNQHRGLENTQQKSQLSN